MLGIFYDEGRKNGVNQPNLCQTRRHFFLKASKKLERARHSCASPPVKDKNVVTRHDENLILNKP